MLKSPVARLSPALVVAMVALLVALGGPGIAAKPKPVFQQRCATGAVKGVIAVSDEAVRGGFPDQWSTAPRLFDARFTCGGGTVAARHPSPGVFDIRVTGNPAGYAVGSAHGAFSSFAYTRLDATTWRVYTAKVGEPADAAFVLVLL